MYCVNGNSSWYNDCGPLFGGCPLLGVSVIGGSTVYTYFYAVRESAHSILVGSITVRFVESHIILFLAETTIL